MPFVCRACSIPSRPPLWEVTKKRLSQTNATQAEGMRGMMRVPTPCVSSNEACRQKYKHYIFLHIPDDSGVS